MTRPVAACALTAALFAAGCGDSRLDSGELHDKVSAACAQAHKELAALPDPTDQATAERFASGGSKATKLLIKNLSGLKPPTELEQSYSSAVGLVRQQGRAIDSASRKLSRGGDAVVVIRQLSDESVEVASQEHAAWQALGVPACADR